MEVGAGTTVVIPPSPEAAVGPSSDLPTKAFDRTPLVVEAAAAAPASEEGSLSPSPQLSAAVDADVGGGVGAGVDGSVSPPADGSASAVVSSDDTSGKEDAAEEAAASAAAAPVEHLSDETKAALVKQAEFYFSDENLPTDAFMKKKLKAGGAQGWVPLKVICNFPKVKKLSKDIRAIAAALEGSDLLVVSKATRVRRKTPFKFPDKDGMSDVTSRTVVAVNIPADSTVESLTPFFSSCGVAEAIRVIHKGKNDNNKNPEIQTPVGPNRDLYATCQFSTLEEAIRAVNELTDRKSWRGGLRVSLANGVTVEKALAKLKAATNKKVRQEQKDRSNSRLPAERAEPGSSNVRDGQMRSRSLTELELDNTANGGAAGRGGRPPHQNRASREDGGSSGDGGDETGGTATATRRKPRSVSNVDALYSGGGTGAGTLSSEGWSWIKKDGTGSRKSGNRIPFAMGDVVMKDGDQQPLQKGDHVEYRPWKDTEGRLMAVRVERVKERSRPAGGGGGNRATQAHFRMAVGPEEGQTGFAAGRGRPIVVDPAGSGALRRPRGSSMGGADSKVFVPSSPPVPEMAAAAAAEAAAEAAAAAGVAATLPQQFEDAD
eukprot:g2958.t1